MPFLNIIEQDLVSRSDRAVPLESNDLNFFFFFLISFPSCCRIIIIKKQTLIQFFVPISSASRLVISFCWGGES